MLRKKVDPLDDALTAKEKLAAKKKADDISMIDAWQADRTPELMRPIIQRYMPMVKSRAIQWKAPAVPQAAFETKGQNLIVGGVESYDKTRGTAPETWMTHRLQPLKRFNVQEQNYAMIPEAKAARIGDIQAATDELKEEIGRDPTTEEIAESVNPQLSKRQQLTAAQVQQIQSAQRKDIIGTTFESDPVPRAISRERQIVSQLRPTLKADQQEVYDYLYGQNGKPKVTSTTQLAKLLKKSPSQVSRLRTAILNKYNEYA